MKKIIGLIFLIFILSSCGLTNDEIIKEVKTCEENGFIGNIQKNINGMVIRVVCERSRTEIELKEIKGRRQYELEKLKIEALKPIEVKEVENQEEGNKSLKYLENSQKTRDVIEGAAIGYGLYKIF